MKTVLPVPSIREGLGNNTQEIKYAEDVYPGNNTHVRLVNKSVGEGIQAATHDNV